MFQVQVTDITQTVEIWALLQRS